MPPLIGTSLGLSGSSIILTATTFTETVGSVGTLITAVSGLILAIAAWRNRGKDELTRDERAELRRLRREHNRRKKVG